MIPEWKEKGNGKRNGTGTVRNGMETERNEHGNGAGTKELQYSSNGSYVCQVIQSTVS